MDKRYIRAPPHCPLVTLKEFGQNSLLLRSVDESRNIFWGSGGGSGGGGGGGGGGRVNVAGRYDSGVASAEGVGIGVGELSRLLVASGTRLDGMVG